MKPLSPELCFIFILPLMENSCIYKPQKKWTPLLRGVAPFSLKDQKISIKPCLTKTCILQDDCLSGWCWNHFFLLIYIFWNKVWFIIILGQMAWVQTPLYNFLLFLSKLSKDDHGEVAVKVKNHEKGKLIGRLIFRKIRERGRSRGYG
jgi:hypothetical protein